MNEFSSVHEFKWKRWDVRSDGKVFWSYSKNCKDTERWVNWDDAIKYSRDCANAQKKYRKSHESKTKNDINLWRSKNKDKRVQHARNWSFKNKERVRLNQLAYCAKRREEDPVYAVSKRLRCRLSNFLKSSGRSKILKTETILGCTFEEFKLYLESKFISGMSWENRKKWHIDHIIPLASAKSAADVVRLSHYTNLQPLWAIDNLKKGAKIQQTIIQNA